MDAVSSRLERLVWQARSILLGFGLLPEIDVQPSDSCWLMFISWDGSTQDTSTLLVSPFTDWVQVLDPDGQDLRECEWVRYLALRAEGDGPSKALVSARREHRHGASASAR